MTDRNLGKAILVAIALTFIFAVVTELTRSAAFALITGLVGLAQIVLCIWGAVRFHRRSAAIALFVIGITVLSFLLGFIRELLGEGSEFALLIAILSLVQLAACIYLGILLMKTPDGNAPADAPRSDRIGGKGDDTLDV